MLLLEISRGGSDGTWCDTAHIGAAQDIWYGMKHNHALVGCTLSSSTQLSGKKKGVETPGCQGCTVHMRYPAKPQENQAKWLAPKHNDSCDVRLWTTKLASQK
jgi:hypothetical protein